MENQNNNPNLSPLPVQPPPESDIVPKPPQRPPFAPTKGKVIASIILAFMAMFLASGAIIVGADSASQAAINFAFIIYPPSLLTFYFFPSHISFFAGSGVRTAVSITGLILESLYVYALLCLVILIIRQFKKQKKISFSILGCILLILVGLVIYESKQPAQCGYVEQTLSVPPALVGVKLLLEKDEFVAVGTDPDYGCLASWNDVKNEIASHKAIDNPTVGSHYYTRQGRVVNSLNQGTTFTLVKMIAVSKPSKSTIDFLILQDDSGSKYYIATVWLGYDESEAFISFLQSDGQKGYLSSSYFTGKGY